MIEHRSFTEHDADLRVSAGARASWSGAGTRATRRLVRDLMRELGLVACQPRTLAPRHDPPGQDRADIPDLVKRNFTATAPNQLWATSNADVGIRCPMPTSELCRQFLRWRRSTAVLRFERSA